MHESCTEVKLVVPVPLQQCNSLPIYVTWNTVHDLSRSDSTHAYVQAKKTDKVGIGFESNSGVKTRFNDKESYINITFVMCSILTQLFHPFFLHHYCLFTL